MTADGRRRVSAPGFFESPKAQAPGSKRISRGFFSLFSSAKGQPQPLAPASSLQAMNGKLQRTRASIPSTQSLQALPGRFDAISLTSPSQRDDPAFSRDPNAHPFVVTPPRDAVRTRSVAEPGLRLIGPPNSGPVASQQQRLAELQEKSRENAASYSSSSQASESSLTLPSTSSASVSGHSQGHSIKSPSSSSSLSRDDSFLVTPTHIFPSHLEAREDSLAMVASPVEKDQPENSKDRPLSPPPEYEFMVSPQEMRAFEIPAAPRPELSRNDSAPELHHIEPPALPHRSATAPTLGSAPAASGSRRATNTRKPQAYDLDKIDELDESNPLGVALHHEGPFQVIASVLKGPQSQPSRPQAPKPPRHGGSLNISPGQVLPSNFSYLYHQQPQPHPQDYGSSLQASTSYIPPQSQFGRQSQSQFGQPPPSRFGQPLYGQIQSNMRAAPHAQGPPNQGPPWSQTHPHHPPSSLHTDPPLPTQSSHSHPHPPYYPETTYIQTQYDPVDPPAQWQNPVHTGNPYHPDPHLLPPGLGHHATYSSEDNSDAYGGIVEDPTPKRERFSAPPHPAASQMDPHYAPSQDGDPNNGFAPRRHTLQAGYTSDPSPFPDAAQSNVGQDFSNIRYSPNPNGQLDPRMFQNHSQLNAGQNLSAMRHSPSRNGQPIALQHAFPPPQAASSALGPAPNEQDRRRPSSYQPQPTVYANHGPMQRPMEQPTPPMAEHDPRRRASYQPVLAPRAPPADPARSEFERNQYRQQQLIALAQDRPQSVIAPSVATTTNPHRRLPSHIPKHLVMPTPLQPNSPLPTNNPSGPYPNGHYESPNSSQTRLPLQQAQPTRAQTIQMDGNRHLLKKKMSVVQPPPPAPPPAPLAMPPKAPPPARRYMEPPPTVPEPSIARPAQQKEKRPKRLLSKRRSDF
ncbi:hypothetical protein C8R45DRAFT_1085613 [Mycena sanguinolenta]|nr:hypothetical protein C8R45DRAFT_1085613 [Mycena sanguinolenta]